MLFKIVFVSDESEDFLREIIIDADSTFLDLNKIILTTCQYLDNQITSFYICNDQWEQQEQIIREDLGEKTSDKDTYLMEKTLLRDLIEDVGDHLIFEFDTLSGRMFFMKIKDIITGKNLNNPICIKSEGKAPKQLQETDILLKSVEPKDDQLIDEDDIFLKSDSFNEDEFDPEAFEIENH